MPRPLATALLLLVLAGCSAPPSEEAMPARPTQAPASSSAVAQPPTSLHESVFGAVRGTVRDANGSLLPGVRVTLVSIAPQAITDNTGAFVIDELEAGPYVLRAQKAGFAPAATPLDVVAGGETTVAVVLAPDEAKPVLVDFWQGRDRATVMDAEFVGRDNPLADQCLAEGPGGAVRWDGPPVLRFDDVHQLVWPGTAGIEVVLDWTDETYSGSEMLLLWKPHPDGAWDHSGLTPKGQPIRVDVDPDQSDRPFQRFTAWQFAVCTKDQSGAPHQQAKDFDGTVHAMMTLVRGHPLPVLEPEPDLWGNATRILLVDETKHFTATDPATDFYWALGPCNGVSSRGLRAPRLHDQADLQPLFDSHWEFQLFEGILVPNGTARIEARLEWTYAPLATPMPPYLSYRGPDVAPWQPADPSVEHVPDATTESPGSRSYSFAIDPTLTDGAEDVRTAWRFYWNLDATTLCSSLDVHLVAEAVREG